MNLKKIFAGTGSLCLAVSLLHAQPPVPAVKIEKAPVINGVLDDEAWQKAHVITEFYQREPNPGAPVSEKTEVYVCYNHDFLFFGFRCWDDPAKITAKEMARDISLGNDDRVQIILDTYSDRRNAYWFQIGPRGSIGDAIVSDNGGTLNKEWDGLWNGKARIVDYGWEAEVAIPFKTLGFYEGNTQWGLKLIRHIIRKLESSYWPEANVNTQKFQVSDAGTLTGLEGITQGVGLDVSPYVVAGLNTRRNQKNNSKLTGGVDIFYQITPSLKSSLTINTDFAETEVDDRQINLTRFNLHFPEKRDFFLNGSNYFQFGIDADQSGPAAKRLVTFFSRRMGLDQNGSPIPINYGAKLTGQVKDWNIGMLHISDDRDRGNSNFSVARISRNLGKQSSVGMIGTYGNALDGRQNLVAGMDVKLASSKFNGNKNIALVLFGLKSSTDSVRSEDVSWGAQFSYPNDFLNIRAGHHQIGKNFIAGMGFVPRTNIRESYAELMIGPRPDRWGIMQVLCGGAVDYITNFENITETSEVSLTPLKIRFKSGEEAGFALHRQYEFLEKDFRIFGSYVIPGGEYDWWRRTVFLKTKGSRNVWGDGNYGWGNFFSGTRNDLTLAANWKVAVPLFLGGKFQRNHVKLPDGDFTAQIYQLNVNFLFSPSLTLNNYFQYDNDSKVIGWQSRFQWILKPGNEIILAWTSGFRKPDNRYLLEESAARFKVKYNIRF